MRKNIIDDVEIIEPPLEELTKTHSGIKRACASGCLLLILLIVALVVAIRIFTGPGPQTLKSPPAGFPADIPVYDLDNIEKVTFISGRYKDRSLEVAAIFPKIILSPIFLALNRDANVPTSTGKKVSLKNLWQIITAPVGDHRDTVQIEWKDMDATPRFVYLYYKTELRKNGFTVEENNEEKGIKQFSFLRDDGLSGVLYIKDANENQPGTDYAALTLSLPPLTP